MLASGPVHQGSLVPAASVWGQAYQQMGTLKVLEGFGGYLNHKTRHSTSQVCTVSSGVGMKKGEEETYLFFVHSKEGLHWGIGAESRKKNNTEVAPWTQGCLFSH